MNVAQRDMLERNSSRAVSCSFGYVRSDGPIGSTFARRVQMQTSVNNELINCSSFGEIAFAQFADGLFNAAILTLNYRLA